MAPGGDGADDKPPSFDPRTWGPDGEPARTPTSFNPSTWTAAQAQAPSPAPPKRSRRGLLIGGLAVGAAGVGGALYFGLTRRHAVATPTVPPPPSAPTAGGLKFEAASFAALQQQLNEPQTRIPASEAQAASAAVAQGFAGRDGRLRVAIAFAKDGPQRIAYLVARRADDGSGVRLDWIGGAFRVVPLPAQLTAQLCATALGEMNDTSFADSFQRVMHDDDLIAQFAAAMAYDVNFTHDLSPRSQFRAVYREMLDGDGEMVGGRQLVFAYLYLEPVHEAVQFEGATTMRDEPAKTISLYFFDPGGGQKGGWYTEDGSSVVRGLMRTPVDGARVTSGFGMRMHPIYDQLKMHEGVDFGCPVGTTVYAAGDGKVAIAGPVNGYGNYLRIQHSDTLWTAYGHLSAYAPGIAAGVAVKQGQPVGFTGGQPGAPGSGDSTGPHLHFEVRVGPGYTAVDPLTYASNRTVQLSGAQQAAFMAQRNQIDAVQGSCDSGA
jgi:murein DD-endopeptidase MepM/ murein hydrolase activator NlpD